MYHRPLLCLYYALWLSGGPPPIDVPPVIYLFGLLSLKSHLAQFPLLPTCLSLHPILQDESAAAGWLYTEFGFRILRLHIFPWLSFPAIICFSLTSSSDPQDIKDREVILRTELSESQRTWQWLSLHTVVVCYMSAPAGSRTSAYISFGISLSSFLIYFSFHSESPM